MRDLLQMPSGQENDELESRLLINPQSLYAIPCLSEGRILMWQKLCLKISFDYSIRSCVICIF